ncbi:hypothetical protein ACFSTC_58115 [Nonomuraea ferruginea]
MQVLGRTVERPDQLDRGQPGVQDVDPERAEAAAQHAERLVREADEAARVVQERPAVLGEGGPVA